MRMIKDKRIVYGLSVLGVFAVAVLLLFNLLSSERKKLILLKEQRKEMMILSNEFMSLRQRLQAVEGKKDISNVQGIIQAVDEIFSSLGLRDKVKTVKPAGKKETKDGFEEEADVFIEKVSMNQMLNIFHRIENAPIILTVERATIKKSFENPELLNVTLVLSFLKKK
jgi:general secretion pathway protein M